MSEQAAAEVAASESAPESSPESQPEANLDNLSKQEIKELWEEMELKVDGEVIKERINLNDKDYLKKQLQLAKVAQKRMEENAGFKKKDQEVQEQMEALYQALMDDPGSVLAQLGHDVESLAEKALEAKIERLKKDPRELEVEELKQQLQQHKKKEEDAVKAREKAEYEALKDNYAREIEKDLTEAFQDSGLKKNPEIVERLNSYMRIAIREKLDISYKELIPIVREQAMDDLRSLVGDMPDDVLEKMLGFDRVKGIYRKRRIEEKSAKKLPPSLNNINDSKELAKEEKKKSEVSFKDFFSKI